MRIAGFTLVFLLLTGCQATKDYFHKPNHLITIHAVEPVGAAPMGKFQRDVKVGKESFKMRRIPVMSSSSVKNANAIPVGSDFGLRLYMSRHGELLWTQAATEYHGRMLAVLVDSVYRGTFVATPYPGTGPLVLPLRLTESEADLIASQAKLNYETMKRD
ncbi:MAG: hypothetical protein ACI8W8_001916 [Rhodothermales bacterium]|jgi:hypothetical protein